MIQIQDQGKEYAIRTLENNGYEVRDCSGNYIFVVPKRNPIQLEEVLKNKYKILIKSYRNELLKKYIRVSTGSVKAMTYFMNSFLEADC